MAENAFLSAARYADQPLNPEAGSPDPSAINALMDQWRAWRDGNAEATRNAWAGFTQDPFAPGAQVTPEMINAVAALAPIRAYHGSPHDFDAFDLSKIGTGEGSQAFGHGLYFAENPDVAGYYRPSTGTSVLYRGEPLQGSPYLSKTPDEAALQHVRTLLIHGNGAMRGDPEAVLRYLTEGPVDSEAPAVGLALRKLDPADFTVQQPGRMYQVELGAEPHQLLDWDKPLSEQSPDVQRAIGPLPDAPGSLSDQLAAYQGQLDRMANPSASLQNKVDALRARLARTNDATGAEFYRGFPSSVAATNSLRDAGIPGIRYLDAGSRAVGDGTHNYVVFDPSIVNILRKYALPGAVAGGAAATGDDQ
jgi:hypothetical protein